MTEPLDPELRQRFLTGMSHAASTVNIITTDGPAGRGGVTVSAMSSVSADTPKPTLLACVHHQAQAAQKIIDNGVFCVNVLKDDQSHISDTFAGRFAGQITDKFDCTKWAQMPTGAPRVADPLVAFDCRVVSSERVGTHYVFFGEVEDIFVLGRGSPLIYANRAYGSAMRIQSAQAIQTEPDTAASTLAVGCVDTFGPDMLPALIARMSVRNPELTINLIEGDQRHIQESLLSGECEIGLLSDMELPDELDTAGVTDLQPYVLLAAAHPLAGKSTLEPSDLTDHPMVLLTAPPSRDYVTGILQDAGVTPRIAYRSSSPEMVRGMVGHGLGFTILATKPAAAISYDGKALVSRPLRTGAAPSRLVLATRKGAELSQTAQEFKTVCGRFFNPVVGNGEN